MGLSNLDELIPGVGAWVGVLLRLYTLCLGGVALSAVQRLTLVRMWAELLVSVVAGLVPEAGPLALFLPLMARLAT